MVAGIRQIRAAAGKRFPDELLKPIRYATAIEELTDGQQAVVGTEQLFAERMRKLEVLAVHLGAKFTASDSGKFAFEYALIRLAIEYVPGFRTASLAPRSAGRGKKWTVHRKADLIRRVDEIMPTTVARTYGAACARLVELGEFQEGSSDGTTARALRKRLSEARADKEAMELVYGPQGVNIISEYVSRGYSEK